MDRDVHQPGIEVRSINVGRQSGNRLRDQNAVAHHPQPAAALRDQHVAPRQERERPWMREPPGYDHQSDFRDLVGGYDSRLFRQFALRQPSLLGLSEGKRSHDEHRAREQERAEYAPRVRCQVAQSRVAPRSDCNTNHKPASPPSLQDHRVLPRTSCWPYIFRSLLYSTGS